MTLPLMTLSSEAIATAYLSACRAELDALKPGNVHRFADGHGMDVAVFETSAAVSAPELAASGRRVGSRVLSAMQATWAAVGMNTNLGILLLCAPLAAAAEAVPRHGGSAEERFRQTLVSTLDALDAADATDVFQAIALAAPGGLGARDDYDVRRPPTIALIEAMRIASASDTVAAQYVRRFADIFDVGLPALKASTRNGSVGMWPAIDCFFAFAARLPDSHIARKYGADRAELVRRRMASASNRLNLMDNVEEKTDVLLALDGELKSERLNPGTSADLTVASLFASLIVSALEEEGRG